MLPHVTREQGELKHWAWNRLTQMRDFMERQLKVHPGMLPSDAGWKELVVLLECPVTWAPGTALPILQEDGHHTAIELKHLLHQSSIQSALSI